MATEPKVKRDGLAVSCPCTPVPDSETAAGEPDALLTIEMAPVLAPAEVGANVALTEELLPALMVNGRVAPLTPNPEPVAFSWVMVTDEFPGLVSEIVCDELLPTAAFPKLMLEGVTVSCGCDATPAPLSAMVNGEFDALLTSEMLPLRAEEEEGEYLAVNVVLWPAVRVEGVARPAMLTPAPEILICEMVMVAEPELVSVTGDEPVDPTFTLPKSTLAGFAPRVAPPATPVPERVKVCGELGALSVKLMLPCAAPAAVGANCAEKVMD